MNQTGQQGLPPDALDQALQSAFRSWEGLLELVPIGVCACDHNGIVRQYNRRAAELWGRSPELGDPSIRYCGHYRVYRPNGVPIPIEQNPMAEVLRSGNPVRDCEVVLERPDGTRISVLANIDPVFGDNGKIVGGVNCFQDISYIKSAERRMREQDQRLYATYERATVGIAEVDADGYRMRVNEMACEITGRKREELLVGNIFDGMFAEDVAAERPLFDKLVSGEIENYSIEKRLVRKDGRVLWVSMLGSAVRDADGKFLYSVRVFQDITDRKLISDALAAKEQRLASTYESALISITEIDGEGNIIRVNEMCQLLTGRTREELLGRNIFRAAPKNDESKKDWETFADLVKGKIGPYQCEKRIIRKDGSEIWVGVSTSAVRDREGKFLYAVRVMRDINERKLAEEKLRESERRYRTLLETLPAAVYTTDADGYITYYNQQAADLWGKHPELNKDKWCGSAKLFWPDGRPMAHDECPMAMALREGREIRNAEAQLERPDGVRIPFIPYPTLQRDSDGRITGAINMLVDISERKNAETKQRIMIDELNHRVKNTLATIQSIAKQSAVAAISPEVFRERLVGRLIALGHAHDQLSNRNWEKADLSEIASAVFAPFRKVNAENISVRGAPVELTPRAGLIFAMVFHELAANAAKFGALSDTEGKLAVEWEHKTEDGRQKLCVYWKESGGPSVKPPQHRGFGTALVERGVSMELGGDARLDFAPQGVECEIKIPVEASRAGAN